MKRIVLSTLLAITCNAATALEVKGVSVGANKAEALSLYPDAACMPQSNMAYDEICHLETTFANVPVKYGIYFWEGKVDGMAVRDIPAENSDEIFGALKAKHGPPLQDGGRFAKSSWVIDDAAMIFTPARTSSDGKALLIVMSRGANKRAVELQKSDM